MPQYSHWHYILGYLIITTSHNWPVMIALALASHSSWRLYQTPTRRHVSFMYSYPNQIPLNAKAVRRIAAALEPFDFDDIRGAWWDLNIIGGARAAFNASVARYLAAIA